MAQINTHTHTYTHAHASVLLLSEHQNATPLPDCCYYSTIPACRTIVVMTFVDSYASQCKQHMLPTILHIFAPIPVPQKHGETQNGSAPQPAGSNKRQNFLVDKSIIHEPLRGSSKPNISITLCTSAFLMSQNLKKLKRNEEKALTEFAKKCELNCIHGNVCVLTCCGVDETLATDNYRSL